MNVILSIKPKYVKKILNGTKKYEFRKNIFRKEVKEILVYATHPVKKIVCKFRIGKIIMDKPENLWNKFGNFSGLEREEFFAYFKNKKIGVAIEIKEVYEFMEPIDLSKVVPESKAPQSWFYLPTIQQDIERVMVKEREEAENGDIVRTSCFI